MISSNVIVVLLAIIVTVVLLLLLFSFLQNKSFQKNRNQFSLSLQNLRYEFTTKLSLIEKKLYEGLPGKEVIVFDGRNGISADDFIGNGSRVWDYVSHQFIDGNGEGSHRIHDNVVSIYRSNTPGRYELYLKRFVFEGRNSSLIPKSNTQATRNFRVAFEVKKGRASHVLRFVFKGQETKEVLDEKDYVVFNPDWQKTELFFTIASTEDAIFRIDDLSVMQAPSSIEIRNLVLFEK